MKTEKEATSKNETENYTTKNQNMQMDSNFLNLETCLYK